MDPAKLKVVELRAELAKRGLDQKGVKAVLVARLQEALEAEEKEEEEQEEVEEEEEAPDPKKAELIGQDEASAQSIQSSEAEVTHAEEDSSQFVSYQEESESKLESEVNEDSVVEANETSDISSDVPGNVKDSFLKNVEQNEFKAVYETSGDSSEAAVAQPINKSNADKEDDFEPNVSKPEDDRNDEESSDFLQEDNSSKNNFEDQSLDTWQQGNQQGEESEQSFQIQDSSLHLDDSNAQDALETSTKSSEAEDSKQDLKNFNLDKSNHEEDNKMEVDVKPPGIESNENTVREVKDETNSRDPYSSDLQNDQEIKEEPDQGEQGTKVEKREGERERKNRWDDNRPVEAKKRQRSPSEKRKWSPPPRKPDDEPDYDENAVLLSWYDSDLHMLINKENFSSASLISHSGFGYVWAGARSTFGFEKGKVYYEVRITENISVPYLEDEPNPNVLRVGWSVQNTSLQLGEEPLSYGFGGTGKISTNCQFQNYGKPFLINDVVGCYLDLDANQVEISFTINGENQGVAYSIPHEELKGQPLFPHILSKNCGFEVNFGNQDPWSEVLPGFTAVGKVPLEDRVAGPKRPAKREDCEVIMMVGLPGSGKTTWATKYAAENKDKMYNILGTNALIDKMKVMGMPRRRNYSGRWESLIAKCTKCLNSLLEIAAFRRRNYIIDQTNVYPSAQRRKMRGFEGFVRRAVVVVPTDEELKARTAKREADEGKDVPDTAVLEMKANYVLPEKGDIFNEVTFTELQEEEAKPLIAQYNKEGNDAGYYSNFQQQQKRFRPDDNRDRRDFRNDDRRNDNRGRMDNRRNDGWRDRGFNNRRPDQRGGWGGGGPPRQGGGWRDNRGGGWRGGPQQNRFNDRGGPGPRDRGNRDYRDRRDGGSGGKMDRRDRDDKSRPKNMNQGQNPAWSNQAQGGYNQGGQGWGQGYSNQAWGNWNQNYNQQQWKGYGQQAQQQAWGQQGWGGQGWGNTGWNQQYNYQYPQSWGTQQGTGTTDASQTGSTDASAVAASYASYGQTPGQAGAWAGYTTVGSTGYASMGSTGSLGTGTGAVSGSTGSAASYTPTQKQYRQDPRKSS